MLRNILKKLRSNYRLKVEDTTKEWEETGETQTVIMTDIYLEVKRPFWERVKFVFTGKTEYQMTENQLNQVLIRKIGWK